MLTLIASVRFNDCILPGVAVLLAAAVAIENAATGSQEIGRSLSVAILFVSSSFFAAVLRAGGHHWLARHTDAQPLVHLAATGAQANAGVGLIALIEQAWWLVLATSITTAGVLVFCFVLLVANRHPTPAEIVRAVCLANCAGIVTSLLAGLAILPMAL